MKEFNESTVYKEMGINSELFPNHFNFQAPTFMLTALYNTPTKKKNNYLVHVIKSGLKDLKEEIKGISEAGIKIEGLDEMVDIVEKILEFNSQSQEG